MMRLISLVTSRFHLSGIAAAVILGISAASIAPPAAHAQQSEPAAEATLKQIKLDDQMITSFLSALRDIVPIAEKLEATGEQIDDKVYAELDGVAQKNGFGNYANFEDVRANIMMVMFGIDSENGTYSDPRELLMNDIEAVKADQSIPAEERKEQVEDLTAALQDLQPLEHKENIAVVQKRYKEIEAALQ